MMYYRRDNRFDEKYIPGKDVDEFRNLLLGVNHTLKDIDNGVKQGKYPIKFTRQNIANLIEIEVKRPYYRKEWGKIATRDDMEAIIPQKEGRSLYFLRVLDTVLNTEMEPEMVRKGDKTYLKYKGLYNHKDVLIRVTVKKHYVIPLYLKVI